MQRKQSSLLRPSTGDDAAQGPLLDAKGHPITDGAAPVTSAPANTLFQMQLRRPRIEPGSREPHLAAALSPDVNLKATLYMPGNRFPGQTRITVPAPAALRTRRTLKPTPEQSEPFETSFPVVLETARHIPEKGVYQVSMRAADEAWIYKPLHDRRDKTETIRIPPDIHVVNAVGQTDVIWSIRTRQPEMVIRDKRRNVLTPKRLAARLGEKIGMREGYYTPGKPVAVLSEHSAEGGHQSFCYQLMQELRAPVYGLVGDDVENRRWVLFEPPHDASARTTINLGDSTSTVENESGKAVSIDWTGLKEMDRASMAIESEDDPVKIERFLAAPGTLTVNAQRRALLHTGARGAAEKIRSADDYAKDKIVTLVTRQSDPELRAFAGQLADELGNPVMLMNDEVWRNGRCFTTNTVTAYRIEERRFQRVETDDEGNVFIDRHRADERTRMLWINFGQEQRAREMLRRKIDRARRSGESTNYVLNSFEVPVEFVEELRRVAVPDVNVPQVAATHELTGGKVEWPVLGDPKKASDQIGLPSAYIERLVDQIVEGSGRVLPIGPVSDDDMIRMILGLTDRTVQIDAPDVDPELDKPRSKTSGAAGRRRLKRNARERDIGQPHPKPREDGRHVLIKSPTVPTESSTWTDPSAMATFVPGGQAPEQLFGLPMRVWDAPTTPEEWNAVPGQNPAIDAARPLEPTWKTPGAGVVILEPDGRVWMIAPTNKFGGDEATFPKGRMDDGISLQATAIKEAWEETGLQVRLVEWLCDVEGRKMVTRYILAIRVGGTPVDAGSETQGIHLVPRHIVPFLVQSARDQAVAAALEEKVPHALPPPDSSTTSEAQSTDDNDDDEGSRRSNRTIR